MCHSVKEVVYVLVMLHCIPNGTFSLGRKCPWLRPAREEERGWPANAEQFEVVLQTSTRAVLNLACIWAGGGVTRVWCRSVMEMHRSNLLQGGQLCCFVLAHLHSYT